jgi:hypothetical protein
MPDDTPSLLIADERSVTTSPKRRSTAVKVAKKTTKSVTKNAANNTHKQKRPFPVVTLEEAIRIPQKIKELNGGNPWPPADIAKALDKSPKTNTFFYLTAAARDYGLTEGTRDTDKILLTDLGRKFVYAGNSDEEHLSLQEAFFKVSIFTDVYNHYKGPTLPELKYLGNTLKAEFKLDADYHEDFHRLFQANCRFIQKYGDFGDTSIEESKAAKTSVNYGSNIITLASPKAGAKLRIFVALPFSEKSGKWPRGFFSEVLNALITPAGVEAGFNVETARKEGSDIIQATIVNELLSADLVVADLTDHNPNVLFELGLRMAFDKPVALIRAEGTAPIFDVDSMLRVWEYTPNLWRSTLESDIPALTAHIKGAWENRKTGKSYLQLLKEQ